MKSKEFYERQIFLIDKTLEILKENLKIYKEDYKDLFYDKKDIPSHILQPLLALKNKIILKPIYSKVQLELNISHIKAKKLIEYYGFSFIIHNLNKIKKLIEKEPFEKVKKNLYNLIK